MGNSSVNLQGGPSKKKRKECFGCEACPRADSTRADEEFQQKRLVDAENQKTKDDGLQGTMQVVAGPQPY